MAKMKAIEAAVIVLPIPPFWFIIAIVFMMCTSYFTILNFFLFLFACSSVMIYSSHSCFHLSGFFVSPSYHLHHSQASQNIFASPAVLSSLYRLFAQ